MTARERVQTALRRREPDRVPRTASFCPSQQETFRATYGSEASPTEHFKVDIRHVGATLENPVSDFSRWITDERVERVDEWGVGWFTPPEAFHFTSMVHPLRDAETEADINSYPFPECSENAASEIAPKVAKLQEAGYAVMGGAAPLGGTVFWPAYKLVGMQKLLESMYTAPEMVEALLDKVTEIVSRQAAQLAEAGVDIVHTADDLGTQRSLMISVDTYRTWFKPRMKAVVEAAKSANPDVLVTFHSDGNVFDLIPDFIEIGIDVLNPVQPECMDVDVVKREFGNDLSFWGGVGTQTTLPFGSPEDVEQCVKDLMESLGRGGGFMIAPTHLIEPEVPWENIETLFASIDRYGVYG